MTRRGPAQVLADKACPRTHNPHFLVTSLPRSPLQVYESVYCQCGEIENRIKELHELEFDPQLRSRPGGDAAAAC